MMKKLCSFLLVIAIMTSFAVPIYAEADPRFELTSAKGKVGETVQIKLEIKNNPGITALSVSVGYSDNNLELMRIADAGLFEDGISTGEPGSNPMRISWYASDSSNTSVNGTFVLLNFKIKEGAKSSKISISYNPENVFDNSFQNKSFLTTDGIIAVGDQALIFGDLDGNSVVDVNDATIVQKYAAKMIEFSEDQLLIADVDGNETVDVNDATMIQRIAAKIIEI